MATKSCFVPPFLLKNVAQRADGELRDWAIDSLVDAAHTRGHREGAALAAARVAVKSRRKLRTVYTANQTRTLPGEIVRSETDQAGEDLCVNEAFEGAGRTYDFYDQTLRRNSIDNEGLPIESTVHYGRKYANAFWNGRQMVYGDGDGHLFHRFTSSLEVIAHELTHGVIQYAAGLQFDGQAGALNEHFADVFGTLVKQYALSQPARSADWLLGANLFTERVNGKAIRSMSAPGTAYDERLIGKDVQPAHMDHYVETHEDDGGVHINSGIPNKAFYSLAFHLGGNAWESAGRIWYVTLCNRLRPTSDFQECADATYIVAGELYGRGSRVQKAVRSAWKGVGITPSLRVPKLAIAENGARLAPLRNAATPLPRVSVGEEAGVRPEAFLKKN